VRGAVLPYILKRGQSAYEGYKAPISGIIAGVFTDRRHAGYGQHATHDGCFHVPVLPAVVEAGKE
jgi:hypothetical protein